MSPGSDCRDEHHEDDGRDEHHEDDGRDDNLSWRDWYQNNNTRGRPINNLQFYGMHKSMCSPRGDGRRRHVGAVECGAEEHSH
jgi:hypothetical protein